MIEELIEARRLSKRRRNRQQRGVVDKGITEIDIDGLTNNMNAILGLFRHESWPKQHSFLLFLYKNGLSAYCPIYSSLGNIL